MMVRFPAYRQFSDARVEINDAMMALLIGARLGEHALRTSAASPDVRLPALFGQIEGIHRVNRTAGDAATLLAGAEQHLAYMAIPYALSVHGAFIARAAEMLRDDGRDEASQQHQFARQADLAKLSLENAHEYVAERCLGRALDADLLSLFHMCRRVRNRIVHFGGAAGSRLASEYRNLSQDARDSWENLAGRSLPAAVVRGRLELGEGELVVVLAISRHLGQEVNGLLARTLSREYWAKLAVCDYRESHPERFGQRNRRARRLLGHADRLYRPLALTAEELLAAVEN
jgi:hypothetical protein